ncbi:transposase [Stappia indica]|uniref:transposase n=1 Tax=Stappia indica TaxID=538381 RepID=UPI001CD7186A|nr:transposase [Stappia indica]MCA1300582.1 transposase [Stappia indica]
MPSTVAIDLSAIPADQRDAVAALLRERDTLKEINRRLEHLIAELNHAVHGKRSEKLSEDERQLAFEDLETAIAEVEESQDTQLSSEGRGQRFESSRVRQCFQWLSEISTVKICSFHRFGTNLGQILFQGTKVPCRPNVSRITVTSMNEFPLTAVSRAIR